MARRKKNPEIAVAQIASPEIATPIAPREKQPFDHEAYLGVSAKVAKSTVCNRNWPWRNARKHFPNEPLLRTVDKYFIHAQGGPLFVDEPVTESDVVLCKRKAQAMKSEKIRYIYITSDMTEEEAVDQLGVA